MADLFRLDGPDMMVVTVAEAMRRGGLPIRVLRREADLQTIQAAKNWLGLMGRSSGAASLTRAARHVPEAVVKFVPRGGVNTPTELKAQLAYIGRLGEDREVGLQHSLGFEGEVMSPDEIAALIEDWSASWRGMTDYGQTRHMIVSFPEEFDPARAEDAARAAVDRAFSSGEYGDVWEFVSAFHAGDDETPNPHLHVVVQSRGMEHGLWMDTRMHAALSPDTLRRLVAEEAREVGLELNATARFERGYPSRGRSSADYWRAEKGETTLGRAEENSALRQARHLAVSYAAMAYRALGNLMDPDSPEMRDALRSAAEGVQGGKPADPAKSGGSPLVQSPEASATLDQIIEIGGAAVEKLDQARAELHRIKDPAQRLARERQLGDVQANASHYLPARPDYLAYELAPPENIYALRPDEEGARAAQRIGLDPKELALRADEEPSLAQVADWHARDIAAVVRGQGQEPDAAPDGLLHRVRGAIVEIYNGIAARAAQSEVALDRAVHAEEGEGRTREDRARHRSRGRDDDDGFSL